jgi:hypothetical protein
MVDGIVALKYVGRKAGQVVGGAVGGAIIGCIPGVILMVINDRLADIEQSKPENVNNSGITGPFQKWKWTPNEIALQGAIVGLIGGAGLGLYL